MIREEGNNVRYGIEAEVVELKEGQSLSQALSTAADNACDRVLADLKEASGRVNVVAQQVRVSIEVWDLLEEDKRLCPVHGLPDCSPLLNGCAELTSRSA